MYIYCVYLCVCIYIYAHSKVSSIVSVNVYFQVSSSFSALVHFLAWRRAPLLDSDFKISSIAGSDNNLSTMLNIVGRRVRTTWICGQGIESRKTLVVYKHHVVLIILSATVLILHTNYT
jgi:hypothetical protein